MYNLTQTALISIDTMKVTKVVTITRVEASKAITRTQGSESLSLLPLNVYKVYAEEYRIRAMRVIIRTERESIVKNRSKIAHNRCVRARLDNIPAVMIVESARNKKPEDMKEEDVLRDNRDALGYEGRPKELLMDVMNVLDNISKMFEQRTISVEDREWTIARMAVMQHPILSLYNTISAISEHKAGKDRDFWVDMLFEVEEDLMKY